MTDIPVFNNGRLTLGAASFIPINSLIAIRSTSGWLCPMMKLPLRKRFGSSIARHFCDEENGGNIRMRSLICPDAFHTPAAPSPPMILISFQPSPQLVLIIAYRRDRHRQSVELYPCRCACVLVSYLHSRETSCGDFRFPNMSHGISSKLSAPLHEVHCSRKRILPRDCRLLDGERDIQLLRG